MDNRGKNMNAEELNKKVISLLDSPDNLQEFADLTSLEENWKKIDKKIKVPSHIGIKEEKCPACRKPIRMIFDKFSTFNFEDKLVCPHCKADLVTVTEYAGYTSDIYLKEE